MITPSAAVTLSQAELKLLALARAALAAFLSTHFLNLPDADFVAALRRPETRAFLEHVAAEPELGAEVVAGARLMLAFLERQADTEAGALAHALGLDRTRLYRGVSPTYGPPPPYETVWLESSEVPTKRLQQIVAGYRADDLAPAEDSHERPDYAGVELAYVESLARREAACLADGDPTGAATLRERQRVFLSEHLAAWAPAFIARALPRAKTDFYHGHLLMLRGFLQAQTEELSAAG